MAKSRKKTTVDKASKKRQVAEVSQDDLRAIVGGQGFEDAHAGSYAIPFLRILQDLSPEVDEDDSAYVKGAKPGMILHTIRQEVYKKVIIVPIKYRETYIEWVPRTAGGGFRGEFDALDPETRRLVATTKRNEKNENILPNGNELKLHANYYCAFQVAEGIWEPVLLSLSASQLKTSRTWLSQLRSMVIEINGKIYDKLNMDAYQWELTTERLTNDKGKWYGWVPKRVADTLQLPVIRDQAATLRSALANNLLTYDRSQQQAIAQEDNEL